MANSMQDQFNEWTNEWRTRLEELRTQFALGKMDVTEIFEQQKSLLKKSAEHWKSELDKGIDTAEEKTQKLRTQLDTLLVQLNLGKAEGKELFEEQRKKIELAMQEVNQAGKEAYHNGYNSMLQVFENQSQLFKTHLEILQLQLALGKMEAKEEAAEIKGKIEGKIKELQQLYTQNFQHSIESWNKQLHEQYEKTKNWVSEFFPKMK